MDNDFIQIPAASGRRMPALIRAGTTSASGWLTG
jgi:hypothetical protein